MSITNKVIKIVKDTIEYYNMFNNDDTVVIGVSGGADSVMLLHCLNSIKEDYNLHIVVAHINHKIRKGDAEKDAFFVEQLCKKMGLEFHLREAYIKELAKNWSMGEEEAGRKVRYGFFNELAGENGKIVTAHNANDNVETVLMRFMRGTGVQGLGGISFKRGNIVRPILSISRADIESYIIENNLVHITDKTNFEDIYTRNKIRLNLIPYLQENFNPNLINTLTSNITNYREDADYFELETEKVFNNLCVVNETCVKCEKVGLRNLHSSLLKRVIIKAIKCLKNSEQIDTCPTLINSICSSMEMTVGSILMLSNEYRVRVDYDYIIFETVVEVEKNTEEVNIELFENSQVEYMGKTFKIEMVTAENIENTSTEFYMPKEYGNNVTFRTRVKGDVFRVHDACHKKLNKFFVDKKISSVVRDMIPLLVVDGEVLWCVGYFASRFSNRTGEFYKFTVI